jgi:hypothetical protein
MVMDTSLEGVLGAFGFRFDGHLERVAVIRHEDILAQHLPRRELRERIVIIDRDIDRLHPPAPRVSIGGIKGELLHTAHSPCHVSRQGGGWTGIQQLRL